jgi:hypothetical protein
MRPTRYQLGKIIKQLYWPLILGALWAFVGGSAVAQEEAVAPPARIFITDVQAESAPTIDLLAYGVDGQGNPASLTAQPLLVQHGEERISDVQIAGTVDQGTFTLFILDITPGTSGLINDVQQAIERFAAEPYMRESMDYVAVFRIGETAAVQMQEPTPFHNSVRNLFADPIQPTSGSTALIDSVVTLLNNFHTLPAPGGLAPSVVIISDGTDTVSSQFRRDDLPNTAFRLGIPIHTIWVNNTVLQQASRNDGRDYLSLVASGTGGRHASVTDVDQVNAIWGQIARFRSRTILRYTVANPRGGENPIVLSLANNLAVQDSATVTLSAGAPSVVINLPPESREMTLANLNEPVTLSFSTSLSWLDGVDRSLRSAELLVNGLVVQSIDVNRIARFDATISNFVYGENRVQIVVIDEQGSRAVSPEIVLTVNQGAVTELPEAVQPPSTTQQWGERLSGSWTYIGGCLAVLFIVAMLIFLTWAVRRFSILRRLGVLSLLRQIPFLRPYMKDVAKVQQVSQRAHSMKGRMGRYAPDVKGSRDSGRQGAAAAGRPQPFLEVIEATTRGPSRFELTEVEMRIGRSPAQSEIAFENDITVSRIHSSIVQEGADYRIYDEQSTSGTWVNEQRAPEYGMQLVDGDEIRLGAVRLRFRQP